MQENVRVLTDSTYIQVRLVPLVLGEAGARCAAYHEARGHERARGQDGSTALQKAVSESCGEHFISENNNLGLSEFVMQNASLSQLC